MSPSRILAVAAAVVVGAAAVVAGEIDDSPGLQLIGGALVVGPLVATARRARRHRQENA